jgi:putative transposase
MPSTHLSLHYHIIFSTKHRLPLIQERWKPDLHAYLGGILRDVGGVPESVGGIGDHVHLLVGLRATHTLADVLREIKAGSSRWVHEKMRVRQFSWQDGYGAFTVSPSSLDQVRAYIADQERHHERKTFEEEYVEFLRKSGIEFDERFLW